VKRRLDGRFSTRHYYKLPYENKIKPVLMWYYACLGVGVSCYLIGGAFYECFQIVKTKFYETKRIVIINEVGAGDSGGDIDVNRPTGEISSEVSEPDAEDTIRRVAEEMGFEETENLVRLALCESSFNPACGELNNPECINPINNSFDRGYFQISRKYHPEVSDEDAFNVEKATEQAIRIVNERGFSEWTCWKYL